MKIQPIRQDLKNIALLAKEYHEKLTPQEIADAQTLGKISDEEGELDFSKFDRQFVNAVESIRKEILDQINFFLKRILLHLSKDGENVIYLDEKKSKKLRKKLTEPELHLLSGLFELQLQQQYASSKQNGKYKKIKAKYADPKLDKVLRQASYLTKIL